MQERTTAPPPIRPDPLALAEEPFYGSAQHGGLDLRELADLVVRGKWIILACIVALTVPVAVWTFLQPSMYSAYAVVLVDKKDDNLGGALASQSPAAYFAQDRNLENELLVLRESLPLAEKAAETVLRTPETRRRQLSILAPDPEQPERPLTVRDIAFRLQGDYVSAAQEGTDVDAVRVSGVSTNPAEAAYLANVYANAFASLTKEQSRAGVSASRAFLEEQVQEKGSELAGYDDAVKDYMNREGAVALDQETEQLVGQIASLQAERDAADVQIQLEQARIASIQSELGRIQPGLGGRPAADVDGQLEAAQERARTIQARLAPYYARNPELRTAADADLPGFVRTARDELARAEADVARLSAQLTANAAATGGGGPGDQQSAFQRSAGLRTQLADARTALSGAQATRSAVVSRLAEYDNDLAGIPTQAIDLARLQRDRLAAERLFQSLDENLQQAQVTEEGELGYARVIRPAFAPDNPFAPRRALSIALALVSGLVVGLTLAVARGRLDHRVSRPDDIQRAGHTLLGTIPDFSTLIQKDFNGQDAVEVNGRSIETRLIALLNPMARASETYRALRTSIQFSRPDAVVQTILVTSANPAEGKSITSANLALVFAQAGRRVLLVDCDLRRPTVHKKFGINREPGLSHAVFNTGILDMSALAEPADDLHVLPAGQLVPNPSEILGSKRMRDLIEEMKSIFDVVIFDVPPVHAATDAVLLSTQADATIVVARADSTKDFELESAVSALHSVGANLIGIILNGFDVSKSSGYKYKYAYRYGGDYAYGHENQAPRV